MPVVNQSPVSDWETVYLVPKGFTFGEACEAAAVHVGATREEVRFMFNKDLYTLGVEIFSKPSAPVAAVKAG